MSDVVRMCSNCQKKLVLRPSAVSANGNNFCNHHCAASFTNSRRLTKATVQKRIRQDNSMLCNHSGCLNHIGLENILFCSDTCRRQAYSDSEKKFRSDTVNSIREFVNKNNRLPFKREFPVGYKRILASFGAWNKMVKVAGYEPNPVRFAKKFTANDGHSCDSLSEKIVDDWLFARKIPHLIKVKYPWNNGMATDFKVEDYWIELFGLCGQLESYDNLMKLKLEKIKKYKLKLISLYLNDLFLVNHLEEKLSILRK